MIVAIDKWREEGKALREKLVAERDVLAERVDEINKRLAMIPAEKPEKVRIALPLAPAQTSDGIDPGDSVSEIVRKLLRASEKPLTAAELIDNVHVVLPEARRETVHSVLNQWKRKKLLQAHGRKGKLRFEWKGPAG